MDSVKEIWDTLRINLEGTRKVCEGRICAWKESSIDSSFMRIRHHKRCKYILNKIRSLGGEKWSDKDVVDKILSAYMARDVNLPTLISEKSGFKRFTPSYVIGRIEEHLVTVKVAKISQEMSKVHEQLEKNNGVALKASKKEKGKAIVESIASRREESDSDEDMALFIKRSKRVMRQMDISTNTREEARSRGSQTRHALVLGKLVTSLPISLIQIT
jgi:hypothetical protein